MEQLFSAGKAYLKINSLVKTPLHEFMAVERSGLWAPVVVQFYPWFKFYFSLFQTHYHILPYPKTTKTKKFKPGTKLNHNIYMPEIKNT